VNGSSGEDGDDRSFADVVNNLSGGPWRIRRHHRRRDADPATPRPVPAGRPPSEDRHWVESSDRVESDEENAPAVSASVVRPYTWTGGRTAPVFDLAVETLVSSTQQAHEVAVLTSAEHRTVAELCCAPRSVAEVAALLSLPLGVVRVLLADMAEIGLVRVHRSTHGCVDSPDMALMERVLSGLRRL
jgi:hypothetical protein